MLPWWQWVGVICSFASILLATHLVKRCQARERAAIREMFRCHELLLKARDVLGMHDDFDARHTSQQIGEHLVQQWASMGLSELDFKRMSAELIRRLSASEGSK